MKCAGIERLIVDQARGLLLDRRASDEIAAHVEACAGCAARLAGERGLTAALRGLAAEDEATALPAGREQALLSAFRAQRARAAVVPIARRPTPDRALIGMAAGIVLLCVVAAALWPHRVPAAGAGGSALPAPAAAAERPAVASALAVPEAPGPERWSRLVEVVPLADRTGGSGTPESRGRLAGRAREVAGNGVTDGAPFVALGYSGVTVSPAGMPIVRVAMLRGTLAAMGLPSGPADGWHTSVDVDVLVGHDGIGRAIRIAPASVRQR